MTVVLALCAASSQLASPAFSQPRGNSPRPQGRGALVRLQPESTPAAVRIIAVPNDRLIVYRHSILVGIPGTAVTHPVDGISPALLQSPEFKKHINEPMLKPYVLPAGEYFVMGEEHGKHFVELIPGDRIAERVQEDGRAPNLPYFLHQFGK